MGQTVDNGINNMLNIGKDMYKSGQAGIVGSDFAVDKNRSSEKSSSAQGVDIGYKYDKKDREKVNANTTMDNFEEYLKNRQEKAKEAGEDAATKEREAKDEAKEISRNLSSEEIKKLKMMGIDVSSAKLSDIMGMVNTMRGEAHRQETKELLANAAIRDGEASGVTIVGGATKLAGTDVTLEGVSVAEVADIKNKENMVQNNELPTDAEISNINESILSSNEAPVEGFNLSNNELVYIIKNELQLTKDNLHKAHYSGSMANKVDTASAVLDGMMPQIEKIIEQAGYEIGDNTVGAAKFMLDNQLPVTTDSLKIYMEYQNYVGKDIQDVELASINQVEDKAKALYKDVSTINPAVVYDMAIEGRQLTIASVLSYSKSEKSVSEKALTNYKDNSVLINKDFVEANTENDLAKNISEKELKAITSMRQMEEIRLSMTMDAATKLVKSDFNIDTRELTKVVSKLKAMEEQLVESKFKQAGVEPTKENISLYNEINEKVASLGNADAKVVAAPLKGISFTVNALYEEGVVLGGDTKGEEAVKSRVGGFEAVRRSYEAVGTAPRADMGDSIKKAFANVDDILTEMNLPVNYETERAVRILGYNSMEITNENITQVISYDRQVNQLMDTFYPEAVLSMIKDGINPLDVPIDELNQIIADKNYNKGITEAENFATYLRDMEKQGLVSPEERESYIGIYRVMNKLAKSGDREAGWIFNSGADLTVRNLISAMRSRKATGLNVSVDDEFGALESILPKGKDMELQIESAFKDKVVSPEDIEDVREFLENVQEASDEVFEYMKANNIEVTALNITATSTMLNSQSGIYGLVSEILSKMKFKSNSKEDLLDEESENMTDSLLGEEVKLDFMPESILESLRSSEEMSLRYEDLRDKLTELMYGAGITGSITSLDISTIKTVNAGFNIMSQMAKNNRYQVPVETSDGVKVMNLTIQHNEEKRGSVDISIDGGKFGQINASIRVGEGKLAGYMVSSTSEGNYELQDVSDSILSKLSSQGFDGTDISFGSVSEVSATFTVVTAEQSATLYNASVALVKAIGGVL